MVTPQILPPNATPLERAIADIALRPALDTVAGAPARLRGELPNAVAPWLAAEWFLSDFTRYFPDAHALIAAGLPWLRVRGTAAAVKQALAWIGMTSALEEDGAHLQIDPGTAAAPANLADIRHLVGASIPAHVRLYRLYHGYDRRVLHASAGDRWSDGWLSDDSGVWIDGIKLSFGRLAGLVAARGDTTGHAALHRQHTSRTLYPDVLRWGNSRFGDAPVVNHPVMCGRLSGIGNRDGLRNPIILGGNPPPQHWTGRWDNRTWGRWLRLKPYRRVARASFTLSDDARLGEPNTRLGGYAETVANRFWWSDPASRLSDFDAGRIRTPIDEVFIAAHALGGAATQPVAASTGIAALHTATAEWIGSARLSDSLRLSELPITETTGALAIGRQHTGATDADADVGAGSTLTAWTVGADGSDTRYWAGGWDARRWSGDIARIQIS